MTKHKEKWNEIGVAFLTSMEKRTRRQKDLTIYGLCASNAKFKKQSRSVKRGTLSFLTNIFICSLKITPDSFWFPTRTGHFVGEPHLRKYDIIRGDMAILFSSIPAKEFAALVRGFQNLRLKK